MKSPAQDLCLEPCPYSTKCDPIMKRILLVVVVIVFALACKKDKENPFETYRRVPPTVINPVDTIDPNSFVGIHNNILRPTCANSGCHDGTFEPDYRTIESAYSTLVFQPIIKNNPGGTYQYRVVPGNADMSIMYQRLIQDIDGQSGTMPLSVDPTSDWNAKKDQYINNIKTWINNGAKDQLGNSPVSENLPPSFLGTFAYADNQTTPLVRAGAGQGSIRVPPGTTKITLYFSFSDDETAPTSLSYNKIKLSIDPLDFTAVPEQALTVGSPVSEIGYYGIPVQHTHKIELTMASFSGGQTQYIRLYVKDSSGQLTEIPSSGSADYIHTYFSFIRL